MGTVTRLKRAIRRVINAEVAKSWMGYYPPEDRGGIKKEYSLSKKHLQNLLETLEETLHENVDATPKASM